ncbi:MAG: PRTRC system protein B [Chitinophagaceae bacterium]
MKKITHEFSQMHLPVKALLIYNNITDERDVRVEAYDTDEKGWPINAHPLTLNETKDMAKSLTSTTEVNTGFLEYKGVLPANLLYVNAHDNGYAVWYTPAKKVNLLFKKELTIPSGEGNVPPLIWKATNSQLYIYAITTQGRPTAETHLHHAPFFNTYPDGRVCMGNVDMAIEDDCNLVDFMSMWEGYFWKSYFTHSIAGATLVKGNIVTLWQKLIGDSKKPFPLEALNKNGKTINDLII